MSTRKASYAEQVVKVLREHFPDMADPAVARITTEAIRRQALNPLNSFEFIVDNPAFGELAAESPE